MLETKKNIGHPKWACPSIYLNLRVTFKSFFVVFTKYYEALRLWVMFVSL